MIRPVLLLVAMLVVLDPSGPRAQIYPQRIAWLFDPLPASAWVNAAPWGLEGCRYQSIVPRSRLGPAPVTIHDLFVAGSMLDGDLEVVYGDLEVRMGPTPNLGLQPSWATNNPNPTVVYRGPLRVQLGAQRWRPLGLPSSYRFVPSSPTENLCVEILVHRIDDGGPRPAPFRFFPIAEFGLQRAYATDGAARPSATPTVGPGGTKLGLLLDDGVFVDELGRGCVGSHGLAPRCVGVGGRWPRLGQSFTLGVVAAPPSVTAVLEVGASDFGPGLPVDLAVVGAAGCRLWHDVVAASAPLGVRADGTAEFAIPIPNQPSLAGVRTVWSWLVLDPGAPGGLLTSDYGRVTLGT